MSLKVELKPFSIPEHELEEIRVTDVNGVSRRIGFCPTTDGATIRFVRFPNSDEQRDEMVAEVTRLRAERGLTTNGKSSQPPSLAKVAKLMKQEAAK